MAKGKTPLRPVEVEPPNEDPQVFDLSEADLDEVLDYYSDGRDYWSDFQLASVHITDEAVDAAASAELAEDQQ